MTPDEFRALVQRMRRAQRAYFRDRTNEKLRESKDLERRVDDAIARAEAGPGLFDPETQGG